MAAQPAGVSTTPPSFVGPVQAGIRAQLEGGQDPGVSELWIQAIPQEILKNMSRPPAPVEKLQEKPHPSGKSFSQKNPVLAQV